ncbi:hypothetical protein O1611_g2814 [Lasiodiplodia mahajangana]|uniref:Uncharacterized protein n=1 Tax=Lasiodiplodia mahajangana TaxID=1108764 RepID=A0ACC2JTV6_9PEZI|nr:hypothetical protein O1611_g2814 [Lasiodiplodia mahajangana]
MVHPAFRPASCSMVPSTLPSSLRPRKDSEAQAEAPGEQYQGARSMWTDCSVRSLDTIPGKPDSKDVPPVPRIPSEHRHRPKSSETSATGFNWPAPPEGRSLPPRPPSSSSTITPTTAKSTNTRGYSMAASSMYDGHSITTVSNAASSQHPLHRGMAKAGSHDENAPPTPRGRARTVPQPTTVEDEVTPDDSISRVNLNRNRRPSSSTATRFSDFLGKM